MRELMDWERKEFTDCERRVSQQINNMLDCFDALNTIRLKGYYKQEYSTFKEYCKEVWDLNVSSFYKQLAVEEVKELTGKEDVTQEQAAQVKRETSKPQVATKKDVVVLDMVGKVVPKELEEIFTRGQEEYSILLDYIGLINRQVKQKFSDSDPLWKRFPQNPFNVDLANMRNAIVFAMPYAVCPYCQGDGGLSGKCKACDGDGWVNKDAYERAPK